MNKKLIKLIVFLALLIGLIGANFLYYFSHFDNKENMETIDNKIWKDCGSEVNKCILYFNPVIPIEISNTENIQEILSRMNKLELLKSNEKNEFEGNVVIEFFEDNVEKFTVVFSGDKVYTGDKIYKGKKEQIEGFLGYLEKYKKK